jgi:hypothetical protein
VVVDGKAAIRYLRLNDAAMPGSAERIVVNGTSGGGGLGAALGASGNSPDYDPYLEEVGAAGIDADGHSTIRDDVLAVNLYCPITDLGNADAIYEWLFTVTGTRAADSRLNAQPAASSAIAAQFPTYEESLGLTNPDGTPLDATTVLSQLQKEVSRAAELYMQSGGVIPDLGETFTYPVGAGREVVFSNSSSVNDWLDVDNATDKVVGFDMKKYLYFLAEQASLKPAPAFDRYAVLDKGVNNGTESTLFGTSSQLYFNYAPWSWANNNVAGDGSGTDDTGQTLAQYLRRPATTLDDQLKLINPMAYLNTAADAAPYWYVRVGTRDRDTAPIVSLNLDRKLLQDPSIRDVNYHLAWMQPHAGNYDVPEASAWIARVLAGPGSTTTPTGPAPSPHVLAQPRLKRTGVLEVGSKVKVKLSDTSTWPAGAEVSYAWKVDGRTVHGAKKKGLRLTAGMHDQKVVVVVKVSAPGYEELKVTKTLGTVR